jgi:hypothetical protein
MGKVYWAQWTDKYSLRDFTRLMFTSLLLTNNQYELTSFGLER